LICGVTTPSNVSDQPVTKNNGSHDIVHQRESVLSSYPPIEAYCTW
jgi:hypothetical protein